MSVIGLATAAVGPAFAREAVYTNLMSSANWNAPSNWQDGYVPTADDVAVLTNSPNGSVSRTIAFAEDAAVTVRRNGIPKQVSVPPGGIAYVNF